MQNLTQSTVRGALTDRSFKRVPCDYCGHEIQFQIAAEGLNAECPNCGRFIRLGAMILPSTLALHPLAGERVKKSKRTIFQGIALMVGWPLFAFGLVTLMGLVWKPMDVSQPIASVLHLVFVLAANLLGLLLLIEGRRKHSYWVCSACGHRLENPKELACQGCHIELK